MDLHLEIAGVGNRILAQLIDFMIIGVVVTMLVVVAALACFAITSTAALDSKTKGVVIAVLAMFMIFLIFVLLNCYFIFFEGLWQGQTPGKKMAEIRVIEASGQPLGWVGAIIRNLLRMIDQFLLVGLLSMLLDTKERRIGDIAAGTIVIRERKSDISTSHIKITASKADDAMDVGRVSPAEYDLLVDFLKRRNSLAGNYRPQVAGQLAEHFQNKLASHSEDNAETYLEKLFLAYQARATD